MLVAQLAYLGEETIGGRHHAGFALDGLQEDSGHVVVKRWEALNVTVGVVFDARGHGLEFFPLVGLAGERQRPHGAAVEPVLGGKDSTPARGAGNFERSLVGLGAGIAEKHPGIRVAKPVDEAGRHINDRLGGVQVRNMPQGGNLLGYRLHHRRMTMPQGVHRDARQQVDVGSPLGVGDLGTGTADQSDGRGTIGVHYYVRPGWHYSSPSLR